MKNKIAKAVRVVTIPPLMVTAVLLILWFFVEGVYRGAGDLAAAIAALGLFPVLAYPVSIIIPSIRKGGRKSQRRLAMIFSVIGYVGGMIYAFAAKVQKPLMLIFVSYMLSLIVLVVFNWVIRLRASGHACSMAGPLVLLVYFLGWQYVFLCAALMALVFWSSLTLKRHKLSELIIGVVCTLVGFGSSLLIIML